MTRILRRLAGLALVAGGLAACQTSGSGAPQQAAAAGGGAIAGAQPVGSNLLGEECRVEPRSGAAFYPTYDVYCGQWERPSGTIVQVAGAGDLATVQAQMRQSEWRQDLDLVALCEPGGSSQIAGGLGAVLLDCTMREGGWPYVAFGTAAGGAAYFAEGIPAAQPALETAVAVLSGTSAPPGLGSAAQERLAARVGNRLFGAGDLGDYEALTAQARYYNAIKDYGEAERRYRQAVEIQERVLGPDSPELADALMHLALENSNQERFAVAEDLFRRAGDLVGGASDPADRARYVSYLAQHEANQRNFRQALDYARQATAMRRQLAGAAGANLTPALGRPAQAALVSDDFFLPETGIIAAIEVAQSLYVEAAMLRALGQTAEARARANEALAILDSYDQEMSLYRPQILELRGRIVAAGGSLQEGTADLQTALGVRTQLQPETRPVGLTQLALAESLAQAGQRSEALATGRAGIETLEAQTRGVRFGTVRPYLDLLWDEAQANPAQAQQYHIEMFEAAQRVQGPVAAQTISDAAVRLAASDSETARLIRALQDARRERDTLQYAFNRAAGATGAPQDQAYLDNLRQQIVAAEQRITELEPQVQAASPNLNLLRDRPSGFQEVAALLRPDEALVQFLLGSPHSYVLVVRNGQAAAARIPVTDSAVGNAVDLLRSGLVPQGGQVGEYDVDVARLLYQQLFGPIEPQLAGVNHLIVVASGRMLNLPLGALVTGEPRGNSYADVPWLARRTAISLVPSARSLVDLRGRAAPSRAPQPFIGFGDFVPVRDPQVIMASQQLPASCLDDAALVANAPPLPATADMVRDVAAQLGAGRDSVVLGSAFNENTIERLPLDAYRVVLFGTHALLPGDVDCLSEPALLVSPSGTGDVTEDGLLTYSEIFNLNLDAEVVVLSACNTGGPLSQATAVNQPIRVSAAAGPLQVEQGEADRERGESLAGLARAFFYAGARSLLASQWYVEVNATEALITGTFANLRSGRAANLAEALRQAQLDLASQPAFAHPYFWAGFVVIGNAGERI